MPPAYRSVRAATLRTRSDAASDLSDLWAALLHIVLHIALLHIAVACFARHVSNRGQGLLKRRRISKHPMNSEISMLLRKASSGSAASQLELACCFMYGKSTSGTPISIDHIQAMHWLQLAHEQGVATASILLGQLYEEGKGAPVDKYRAVTLYEAVAKRGDALPPLLLARLFADSSNAFSDETIAVRWYRAVLDASNGKEEGNVAAEARSYIATHF